MNTDRHDHKTWIEIDLSILRNNLRRIAQAIGPARSIILVVKSDAYGHGARATVETAMAEGITRFAVATVDEGVALRRYGVEGEILVLHPPFAAELPRMIESNLTPNIGSEETAARFADLSDGTTRPVHVEINTGMNRLGLNWQGAADTIARIAALPRIEIGGVFTHFRTAEPTDAAAVREQMDRFKQVLDDLETRGIERGLCHAASSYVLAYHADTLCDAVRPGLIAYGGMLINPGAATDPGLVGIAPVMSVRARIIDIRDVAAGEWIQYGTAFRTEHAMRIATLPIGYGMGYARHFSNCAEVLVNGHRSRVVGTIGMDLTVIDLERVDGVAVGDPVTVLGPDGDDAITAEDLACWSGTIPYEVTCRLGNALPRYNVDAAAATPKQTAATESVGR